MPSFRSIVARALLAAGLFYFMLALVFEATPTEAVVQTVILTGLMLPLYMLLDRVVYRRKMRRWEAQRDAK
jgi:hypothetical protein